MTLPRGNNLEIIWEKQLSDAPTQIKRAVYPQLTQEWISFFSSSNTWLTIKLPIYLQSQQQHDPSVRSTRAARGQEFENLWDMHFLAQKSGIVQENPKKMGARLSQFEFQAFKCLSWVCFFLVWKYFDFDPADLLLLDFHQLPSWILSGQWLLERTAWKLLYLLSTLPKSNQAGGCSCQESTQKMNTDTAGCVIRMNILPFGWIWGLSPEHLAALHLRNWETVLKILHPHGPCCGVCAWRCPDRDCWPC